MNDSLDIAGIETSSMALITAPIFWELFAIGFSGVLLMSITRRFVEAIWRDMRALQREAEY